MTRLTVEQATQRLGDLVKAANSGEEVIVVRQDQTAVRLVPVTIDNAQPVFGSAKGLVIVADDFDKPLEDFDEYR
jgi:antitoxin (DNA-binding transcriptional repressor) of toxin-antitoxin stability system